MCFLAGSSSVRRVKLLCEIGCEARHLGADDKTPVFVITDRKDLRHGFDIWNPRVFPATPVNSENLFGKMKDSLK